jgi:hypothetical protein
MMTLNWVETTYLALKLLVLGLLLGFVLLNLLCSLTPSVLQLLDSVCIISSCSITPIDPMSSALNDPKAVG